MLSVTHNAGFFSCCSVRADEIIQYFNTNRCLPTIVDSSSQFSMYKYDLSKDIVFDFFKKYDNDISINYIENININLKSTQFQKYKYITYEKIIPFVNKYFEPSDMIQSRSSYLIDKYGINVEKCIGLYYRGTDKYRETRLASYDSFYTKLQEILSLSGIDNPQVLIQTDSQQFLEYIDSQHKSIHANIIIIKENTVSKTNYGIHCEHTRSENYTDIQNFFATLLILSRCKHFICSSSNCSIWTVYYRQGAYNVHQILNDEWIT